MYIHSRLASEYHQYCLLAHVTLRWIMRFVVTENRAVIDEDTLNVLNTAHFTVAIPLKIVVLMNKIRVGRGYALKIWCQR